MAAIAPTPKLQFFTANGVPLAGGKLYTYAAGTSTPLATYTDQSGGATNTNPIILDSRGEASVWLSTALYKMVLTTSTDVEVWTVDNVGGNVTLTQLAASGGSSLIGFLQSGTSASLRTVQSKLRDTVSVLDFGADPTGATDSTTAMQAAHNTGKLVHYPAGTYKFSRLAAGITSGGIIGDGANLTILSTTSTDTNNLFTFTSGGTGGPFGGIMCRDFQIVGTFTGGGTPAKTGGAALVINPGSGKQANYPHFFNVTIYGIPIGIDLVRCEMAVIDACKFLACPEAGVQVANLYNIDGGDTTITNCVFSNPYTYGAGIKQKNSGGLRVINNKFLGGAQGYLLAYDAVAGDAGPAATGILLINNNSIENQSSVGISLTRNSGSNLFYYTIITNNEIASAPYGISSDNSGFLIYVTISGNTILLPGSGSPVGIALDGANNVAIDNNMVVGNGGSPSGIYLKSCVNAKVGLSSFQSITTNAISLVSPGANNFVAKDFQQGNATTAGSGWSPYGTQYRSPLTSVTFPTAFRQAPAVTDIVLTPGALNGELGGVVNTVTATGFDFYALSSINNIGAVINWRAQGIL